MKTNICKRIVIAEQKKNTVTLITRRNGILNCVNISLLFRKSCKNQERRYNW